MLHYVIIKPLFHFFYYIKLTVWDLQWQDFDLRLVTFGYKIASCLRSIKFIGIWRECFPWQNIDSWIEYAFKNMRERLFCIFIIILNWNGFLFQRYYRTPYRTAWCYSYQKTGNSLSAYQFAYGMKNQQIDL